jgi:hypothetical protein
LRHLRLCHLRQTNGKKKKNNAAGRFQAGSLGKAKLGK